MVAQTAAQELLEEGVITRCLVIAPPKVARLTWAEEHLKWEHLGPVTHLVGTPAQRVRKLIAGGVICIVSAELLPWLVKQPAFSSFDGLVIDEISRFKEVGGKSFKALRYKLEQFAWRVGLSATPVAEAGEHIYGQALLLDNGKSLGRNKERFQGTYMMSDYMGYSWEFQPGGVERLAAALSGLVYVTDSTDYEAGLPDLEEHIVPVHMPVMAREAYEEMAETMILESADVEAPNAAVLVGKLQQVAAGFIYDEKGDATRLHTRKLQALGQLIIRLGGPPVVITYQFRWELAELRHLYPDAVVLADDPVRAVTAWNSGEAKMLLIHPRSAGHGLNLQDGGSVLIQMGPFWSADMHDQVIGRLWRRGQKETVHRYILCSTGTIDGAILDRLKDKQADENLLMSHLRRVTRK